MQKTDTWQQEMRLTIAAKTCARRPATSGAALAMVLAVVAAFWCSPVFAQKFPAKPVKIVVPYAPGGPTDMMGRVLSQQLSAVLGEQVLVDNVPGAGGTIGATQAARAPADGYTLLLGTASTLAISPALYRKLEYKAKDFTPVGLFAHSPFMVVVNPNVPANTLKEFIALAKANPGKYSFGSAGVGNILHISGELFNSMAGVNLLHVPYKGGAPAKLDLVAGRIQAMFEMYATFRGEISAGKVKVLAVASSKHHPLLPKVPTTAEAGLPGYEVSAWFGLVAPKGAPEQAVTRLNAEMQKALKSKEVLDILAKLAFLPGGGSAREFGALIDSAGTQWTKVIKDAGIHVD